MRDRTLELKTINGGFVYILLSFALRFWFTHRFTCLGFLRFVCSVLTFGLGLGLGLGLPC